MNQKSKYPNTHNWRGASILALAVRYSNKPQIRMIAHTADEALAQACALILPEFGYHNIKYGTATRHRKRNSSSRLLDRFCTIQNSKVVLEALLKSRQSVILEVRLTIPVNWIQKRTIRR